MRPIFTPYRPRHLVGANTLVGAPSVLVGQALANAAALQGAQGASLQQNGPTQGRRQNLGFPTTVVNIGTTSPAIVSQPQVWFRPDRLFIASSIVGKFTIQSVEIGNKKQFLNDNPCPASMFSELAVDSYVEYDTCEPAISIAVIATNTDSVTNSITPGMTGRSAY